jgi:hypothetical protein
MNMTATWLVGLAIIAGSTVLTSIAHIVGLAAADLLSWVGGPEQSIARQGKAGTIFYKLYS